MWWADLAVDPKAMPTSHLLGISQYSRPHPNRMLSVSGESDSDVMATAAAAVATPDQQQQARAAPTHKGDKRIAVRDRWVWRAKWPSSPIGEVRGLLRDQSTNLPFDDLAKRVPWKVVDEDQPPGLLVRRNRTLAELHEVPQSQR